MSIAVAAIPSPYIHSSQKRRKNTWYSIADGNWTDPNIWMSNSLSLSRYGLFNYPGQNILLPIFPQVGDDVYVNHTVTFNAANTTVNNLYVSGTLLFDSITPRTIIVNGDIQATGVVNMSNGAHDLVLRGVNNYITSFTSGVGKVTYDRFYGDQNIMDLSYYNLQVGRTLTTHATTKFLTANIVIANNYSMPNMFNVPTTATLECGNFDFTCNGTTSFATNGVVFSKSGPGNILCVGNISFGGGSQAGFKFDGNPDVEFRGGFLGTTNLSQPRRTGTGTWRFTTNNQSFLGLNFTCDANILVVGAITVTSTTTMTLNGSIDGTVAGSTWAHQGILLFNNLASVSVMSTAGVFDYTTTSNTLGYIFAGDYVLPYTSYYSLTIANTGIKSFSAQPTINGNVSITTGTLEFGTYEINVSGKTNINILGVLSKSGAGSVLFVGLLTIASNNGFNFSGNPTVELRGGVNVTGGITATINGGNQNWVFTTNNQTLNNQGAAAGTLVFNSDILISGAISLTIQSSGGGLFTLRTNNSINGNNASSTLDNRNVLEYMLATRPMVTGGLQTNAVANTFKYNLAGNQDVTGGTYRTLEFGGSGVKTLQGNVVVNTTAGGSWSITGTATIDYNGFTITTI